MQCDCLTFSSQLFPSARADVVLVFGAVAKAAKNLKVARDIVPVVAIAMMHNQRDRTAAALTTVARHYLPRAVSALVHAMGIIALPVWIQRPLLYAAAAEGRPT